MHSPRWPIWISALTFGIFLGLSFFTFHFAEGLSYLSNDPAACKNCHIMDDQYDSWLKSSHHGAATCNDCHVPHEFPAKYVSKIENGWNHSKGFTLMNFPDPIRIRGENLVRLQENCIQCHETMVHGITTIDEIETGQARCTVCHGSVGHMRLD